MAGAGKHIGQGGMGLLEIGEILGRVEQSMQADEKHKQDLEDGVRTISYELGY